MIKQFSENGPVGVLKPCCTTPINPLGLRRQDARRGLCYAGKRGEIGGVIEPKIHLSQAAILSRKAGPPLRAECAGLWGSSSNFYHRVDELLRELANPNLHDIPTRLPFRVELWDRSDQHVRWVIAASSSVAAGHAALDAAIDNYPGERFTLRNGILVIRDNVPKGR